MDFIIGIDSKMNREYNDIEIIFQEDTLKLKMKWYIGIASHSSVRAQKLSSNSQCHVFFPSCVFFNEFDNKYIRMKERKRKNIDICLSYDSSKSS